MCLEITDTTKIEHMMRKGCERKQKIEYSRLMAGECSLHDAKIAPIMIFLFGGPYKNRICQVQPGRGRHDGAAGRDHLADGGECAVDLMWQGTRV